MSLKVNVLANYFSQIYVALLGILILPQYLRLMGTEAYGLIGFFTMLQAWFALLDLGLSPTISRETARFKSGSVRAAEFVGLFNALKLVFWALAIVGGGALFTSSSMIANEWLNAHNLGSNVVIFALQIMALSVALRWMCGLYRGVVLGSERLVWLSAFGVFIATLRFIAVFGSMSIYGFTPAVFFLHQLGVAVIEFTGLSMMARKLVPATEVKLLKSIHITSIRPVLKFSLSVAFTSSVWIVVTQVDKLVLSGILPLAEYGFFTLAVLLAGGILILISPISNAIMPRMARLYAEGKQDQLLELYRATTQWVAAIAGSVGLTFVLCAEQIINIWTGDTELSQHASPILRLYAAGNVLLTLAAFPYYLQYARGNMKYHLIGNVAMLCVLIPAIIFAATAYGGVGAGFSWLGINAFFLFLWVPYVHQKLAPGLGIRWILNDILKVIVPAALCSIIVREFLALTDAGFFLTTVAVASTAVIIASVSSDIIRLFLVRMIKGRK